MPDPTLFTDDELRDMEYRARRFSGAYTGTSGSLAADVIRLLAERRQLVAQIDELLAGGRSELGYPVLPSPSLPPPTPHFEERPRSAPAD